MLPGIMLGFDYLWPLSLVSLGTSATDSATASGRRDFAVKIPLVSSDLVSNQLGKCGFRMI
jgi:hypothetical protein